MSDDLTFMMGKYEARIPVDRSYSENHLWLKPENGGFRVGFTDYSVRLLQDVYFLDWTIDAPAEVPAKKTIGEIESSKALSNLYAPFDGRIVEFNAQLLDDPSTINTDNYGSGWLFGFETDADLLDARQYVAHLEGGWEETQRHLKGQLN